MKHLIALVFLAAGIAAAQQAYVLAPLPPAPVPMPTLPPTGYSTRIGDTTWTNGYSIRQGDTTWYNSNSGSASTATHPPGRHHLVQLQ